MQLGRSFDFKIKKKVKKIKLKIESHPNLFSWELTLKVRRIYYKLIRPSHLKIIESKKDNEKRSYCIKSAHLILKSIYHKFGQNHTFECNSKSFLDFPKLFFLIDRMYKHLKFSKSVLQN